MDEYHSHERESAASTVAEVENIIWGETRHIIRQEKYYSTIGRYPDTNVIFIIKLKNSD